MFLFVGTIFLVRPAENLLFVPNPLKTATPVGAQLTTVGELCNSGG